MRTRFHKIFFAGLLLVLVVVLVKLCLNYKYTQARSLAQEACEIFEQFRSSIVSGDWTTAQSFLKPVALDPNHIETCSVGVPVEFCIEIGAATYYGRDVTNDFSQFKVDFSSTYYYHRSARATKPYKVVFDRGYCLLYDSKITFIKETWETWGQAPCFRATVE